MTVGHSEAEPFWVEFLRSLTRRGLRGTKLVISDAHEGLKAAVSKIISPTWQRCRVGLLNYSVVARTRVGVASIHRYLGEFGDVKMTTALLDRLTYHCHIA